MGWLWVLPLLGGFALVAGCFYVLVCVRRLGRELDALREKTGAHPVVTWSGADRSADMYLTVQILNPIEVACANSRLARPISGVSPGLLRRQVYEQMSDELQEELAGHGIQAQIAVVRGHS